MQIQCMHLYNQHSHSSRWLKVETPTLWWLSIFQRFEKYLEIWNQILDFRIPRWCSGKESTCQCGRCKRCGLDLWVRKTLWIRKWQPTPVILLRKFRGQRSLAGCSPWGWRELEITEHTHTHTHTGLRFWAISSEFSSVNLVAQSYLTLCNPMDCNTPGIPVHHQLRKLFQTHVNGVGDAIQSSHPLSSPTPPAFNLSQQQGLFQWVISSHQVAKVLGISAAALVLPMNIQDWFPLGLNGLISCSPRDSQESSLTPPFKNINSSALSFLYSPTLTSLHDYWKNHSLD